MPVQNLGPTAKYNQVLRLDPLNRRADAGLQKIVGRYVEWARSRYKAGNYSDAENYLSSAKKVSEHDERVWRLAEQIRKAKRDAAADERRKREELARQKAAEEAVRRARLEKERRAKAEAARKEAAKRQQASRAVERSSDGRYSKDRDGVITDKRTGLQWYVGPERNTDWYDAKKWVENLRVSGGGWRMPSRGELRSLSQKGARSGEPEYLPPIFKTSGWWVWSGETSGSSSAWGFSFYYGKEGRVSRSSGYNLRPFAVRSRR